MSNPNTIKTRFDAVVTVGEYTNAAGEKKKRYLNVGTLLEFADGRLSLKLETVPVTPQWTGWISFYETKQPDRQPSNSARPTNPPSESQDDCDDEEIPF